MIKKENRRVNVTMSKKLYELIEKDADYEDRSMSYIVLQILKRHYKIKSDDDEK